MMLADGAPLLAGQAGLLLGWRPDEFWAATPDELAAAFGAFRSADGDAAAPVDRVALNRLMEAQPDGG